MAKQFCVDDLKKVTPFELNELVASVTLDKLMDSIDAVEDEEVLIDCAAKLWHFLVYSEKRQVSEYIFSEHWKEWETDGLPQELENVAVFIMRAFNRHMKWWYLGCWPGDGNYNIKEAFDVAFNDLGVSDEDVKNISKADKVTAGMIVLDELTSRRWF